jgi:hypothetical protein
MMLRLRELSLATAMLVLMAACIRTSPVDAMRPYAAPKLVNSAAAGRPPEFATETLRSGCDELRVSSDAGSMTDGPFPLARMLRCDGRVAGEVWIRTVWRAKRQPATTREHANAAGCFERAGGDVECFVRTHAGTEIGWRRIFALADSVGAWTIGDQVKCEDHNGATTCLMVSDDGNIVIETRRAGEYRRHTYDAPRAYPFAANPSAALLMHALDSLAGHWRERGR